MLLLAAAGDVHAAAALPPMSGRFLVASERMNDPRFAHTVVLLVSHGRDGSLGLIVNRRAGVPLATALPRFTPRIGDPPAELWLGGPVERASASVLVDAKEPPSGARTVLGTLRFSASAHVLEAIDPGLVRGRIRVYAGYAGWAPGQLDGEIERGDWRVTMATIDEVFSDDGDALWQRLAQRRGTWVRRDAAPGGSIVLARDLGGRQFSVPVHGHVHGHRPAAHRAVLDVLGRPRGAVDGQFHVLPAPRAGDGCRFEHLSG